MKLFVTDDLAGACREAHEAFTHNILVDVAWSMTPRIFDTAPIADLVTALYAPWHGNLGQIEKWQKKGGLLMWRNGQVYPGAHDVLLLIEPPPSVGRLYKMTHGTHEYAVIQRPIWSSVQKTIDVHNPTREEARRIFEHCKGRRADLLTTAKELNVPSHYLSRMWKAAGARRVIDIKLHLVPDTEEAREWWPKIYQAPKHLLRMWAKQKHLVIKRGAVFSTEPPNYEMLEYKRQKLTGELKALRALLESLPVRPQA